MTTRFYFVLIIFFSSTLFSQTLSDEKLRPFVRLYQLDKIDSLKMHLARLDKEYPKNPETLFLKTLFENDGETAQKSYESFVKNFPKNVFADEALYRMIQMEVAKGRYHQGQDLLIALQKNYPLSPLLRKASLFFDALPKDTVFHTVDVPVKADTSKGKYHLQVGAFSEIRNAQELKSKLEKKGYGPFEFSEKTVDTKKLSLLWLGNYATKESATKAGEAFKEKEKINFSVVEK